MNPVAAIAVVGATLAVTDRISRWLTSGDTAAAEGSELAAPVARAHAADQAHAANPSTFNVVTDDPRSDGDA